MTKEASDAPLEPLWITEAEVVAALDMAGAIAALREGFGLEAQGAAASMVKTQLLFDGHSTLHAIGAVFPQAGLAATKSWAHAPGGATPLLILIDSRTGALRAVIEAFALGQYRTGGVSGLATDLLADPDAREMALVGVGKQAMAQIAAVAAVRRLDHVRVWSRTPRAREAFAERAAEELGLRVEAAASLQAAIDGAQVVTLATRSTEPFLAAGAPSAGAHLNAVGAISPERAEFDPALLDRCAVVASDGVAQARGLSRELRLRYGEDEALWRRVRPLSALLADPPQRDPGRLTLFKAMGVGVSDLSVARRVEAHVRRTGGGRPIPTPRRAAPRLRPTLEAIEA